MALSKAVSSHPCAPREALDFWRRAGNVLLAMSPYPCLKRTAARVFVARACARRVLEKKCCKGVAGRTGCTHSHISLDAVISNVLLCCCCGYCCCGKAPVPQLQLGAAFFFFWCVNLANFGRKRRAKRWVGERQIGSQSGGAVRLARCPHAFFFFCWYKYELMRKVQFWRLSRALRAPAAWQKNNEKRTHNLDMSLNRTASVGASSRALQKPHTPHCTRAA